MKKDKKQSAEAAELRRRAEDRLRTKKPETGLSRTESDTQSLLHELKTHQIEPEMQNEELFKSHEEIEASHGTYSDLYDFAPIGYFTFAENGLIVEVNLTGAEMLGINRQSLLNKPFSLFIDEGSKDAFLMHRQEVLKQEIRQTCEIKLKRKDGREFYAHLQSMAVKNGESNSLFVWTAVSDITALKRSQEDLKEFREHLEKIVEARTADLAEINKKLEAEIIERKLAERLCRESSERYRVLAEAVHDVIFVHNREGRYTYINDFGAKTLNMRVCEVVGKFAQDIFPPEVASRQNDLIQRVVRTRSEVCEEVKVSLPLGNRWTEAKLVPVFDGDGGVDSIIGIVRDITERRQIEEKIKKINEELERRVLERTAELKEANKRLKDEIDGRKRTEDRLQFLSKAIETLPIGITISNVSGKIIYANPADADMHGYTTSELIGRDACIYATPGTWEPVVFDQVHTLGVWRRESVNVRANGETFTAQLTSVAVKSSEGRPIGIITACEDISQRREAETLLRQSEEKYRMVADFTYDWEYWMDADGNYIYVSPSCERITGYRPDEFLKNPGLMESITHPQDRALFAGKKRAALANSDAVCSYDFRIVTRSGEERWIAHTCQAVYGDDGRWLGRRGSNRDITDRKLFELALQVKGNAIETSINGIAFGDLQGTITYVNRSLLDMWGYNEEREFLGKSALEFGDKPEDAANVISALREQGSWVGELVAKKKDGSLFDVLASASMVRDSDGSPLCLMASFLDISERKRSEERLRLLSKAIETLPIGITITNVQGKIIYVNRADADMHGYTPAELIDKDSRLYAPEDRRVLETFEWIHNRGVWRRESINIRSTGEAFPVQLTSIAVKNLEGMPIGIITACEDITSRRRSEEKIIQRQHVMHSVYRIATTPGRSFKTACDEIALTLSKLLGISHVLVIQRQETSMSIISAVACGALIDGDLTGMKLCPCLAGYDSKEPQQKRGRVRNVCPDHPFAQEDLLGQITVPIKDTMETVIGAINVMDRNGSIFTGESIRIILFFTRYIAFVIERNAMEERLRTAQNMEVVGKLAAGVAHEINNPINGIINYAQLLLTENNEKSAEADICRRIIREGNRIAGIVGNLLSLARNKKDEKKPVSISDILSDALALTEARLRKDAIILVNAVPQDLPSIMAQPQQIQQVFLNIIQNAQHALNQKYPALHQDKILRMAGEARKENGACSVMISFHDQGCGIPADMLDRVMTPFFTTKPAGLGTGLGLSISHGIVKDHGGTLTIESEENSHTTVTVKLPAAEEE